MKKFALILGAFLAFSTNAWAKDVSLSSIEQEFTECTDYFQKEYKQCPDDLMVQCHNRRMNINRDTQRCYKKVAVKLFVNFYGQSEKDAEERFDVFSKFIYDQYLFVFSENEYCKKNNCGISLYLYSEYATTEQLQYYINKIIKSIFARD